MRQAAPVIRIAAPRQQVTKPKKQRRRGSGPTALTFKHLTGVAAGGAVFGYIEKTWGDKIPTLPMIGKAGTVAVAAYFVSKRGGMPIARDVAIAAAAIAGYQLGKEGKVSGDDDISGLASTV